MKTEQKAHIIASFGTFAFLVGVLALLWFLYISAPQILEEEGIVVAFGQEETGQGTKPEPLPLPQTELAISQPATQTQPAKEELITQEDEESLALAQQQRAEEEERERKKQEAIAKAQAMGALFGAAPETSKGSGTTAGDKQAGNVTGTSTVGKDYRLDGRELVGKLPLPAKTYNTEGIVVIRISVDKEGNVVNATSSKGTNTSDDHLIQLAKAAAYKAKFSPTDKPEFQVGTITYTFKLN